MNKVKYTYLLFLLTGFLGQILPALFSLSWGSGMLTLIWIYAFLELVCRFHTKKELILTGVVFITGYSLKFIGATGYVWIDCVLLGVFGLALYAVFCVSAYFMRRWNNFAGTLCFPVLWVLEYQLVTLLRLPSAVRVDMMFADISVLIQAERLIGSLGFSFAILWIVSLLRFAVSKRKTWCMVLSFMLFLVLLLPGFVYLYPNTAPAQSLRVAYTTGPYGGDFINYIAPDYETSAASLTRSIQSAALQHAEMLVFNEEAFELDDADEARFIQQCASLAAENSMPVLLGLDVRDTDGSEGGKSLNKMVLINSDGEILNSYQKARLMPVVESAYAPGDGQIPSVHLEINGKSVKLSYLICYDSNFPEYVKRVESDTDLLLLPSWDWSAVTKLHAQLCRAIAVENNLYLLKPTYDGISIAIDPNGQIFHRTSTSDTGYEQIQLVDIPIKSTSVPIEDHTQQSPFVYAIIGTDILSMLVCLFVLAGILTIHADNVKKTKRASVFNGMLITAIIACGSDALSWILDGHTRLNFAVYASTFLAVVLTLFLIWEFIIYLFEYIRGKGAVSPAWAMASNIISFFLTVLTVIMCLNGGIFTVENAVYSDGPLYNIYVLINIGMLVYTVAFITFFRKFLSVTDRIAAYAYVVIPILTAAVNLFIEEWSFAYPAAALSLLLLYTMIQSDELVRLEAEGKIVSYHITHDELTGLHNRRAYENRRTMLKEADGTCGVIFGDLNGLKYTNDHLGHTAGDELLLRFAAVLTGIIRQNEVFRISGDEFVCIMENIEEEVFSQRLQKLQEVLKQDEMPLASIGAVFGAERDIDALLLEAESRMYLEKDAFHKRFPITRR